MTPLLPLLVPLLACASAGDPLTDKLNYQDDSEAETEVPDAPLLLEHPRELRGVWVATVFNINFPSSTGRSAEQLRTELQGLVDTAEAAGLNAIFFQVRPEGDALYDSVIEPWSRYITGAQGENPGLDPLQTLIDIAHPKGIEVHAWFNPYRAKAGLSSALADGHLCLELPQHCRTYGSLLWMDPGVEAVRARTRAVVVDVATRYDLDGVHFDDYFYPYPDSGTPFPDDDSYAASGSTLSRDDWRRDNVNTLIAELSAELAAEAPRVRFGISPFGIYRPGTPPGIAGLDQYASLYADPLHWVQQGWLHYVAPQLYWPTTQTAQAYEPLLEWWTQVTPDGQQVFAGNYLSQLGSSSAWTVDEVRTQVNLTRQYGPQGSAGNIWYHIGPLQENRSGITDVLRQEFYATPVLPPAVPGVDRAALAQPQVTATEGSIGVSLPAAARGWVVYQQVGQEWEFRTFLPPEESAWLTEPGTYAVSAAFQGAVEGPAVVVQVP